MATTGFGAIPVKYFNGLPWNGEANWYYVPADLAAAIYLYDFVNLYGDTDPSGCYAEVDRTAASEAHIIGSVVGFAKQPGVAFDPTNLERKYWPATTAGYILVADNPDLIFHMREDGVGGYMDGTASASGCDIIATAGSTTTGISGMLINSSDATTSGQLRILRRANFPGNPAMGADDCVWEVIINEHALRTVTTW